MEKTSKELDIFLKIENRLLHTKEKFKSLDQKSLDKINDELVKLLEEHKKLHEAAIDTKPHPKEKGHVMARYDSFYE